MVNVALCAAMTFRGAKRLQDDVPAHDGEIALNAVKLSDTRQ
jgi:hypothetical protein